MSHFLGWDNEDTFGFGIERKRHTHTHQHSWVSPEEEDEAPELVYESLNWNETARVRTSRKQDGGDR